MGFFPLESVRSGIDVARRALHPRLPIDPDFVRFGFRLPKGPARIFQVNTISLLPGTLSVELQDTAVRIQVLNEQGPLARTRRILEGRTCSAGSGSCPGAKSRCRNGVRCAWSRGWLLPRTA